MRRRIEVECRPVTAALMQHDKPIPGVLFHQARKPFEQYLVDTYIVVASHGNYDEAALEHVLRAKPRYVGLVASPKRYQSVVDYLKDQKLTDGLYLY